MTLPQVAIIGAGGFAREVLDIFDAVNAVLPTYEVLGYIVDPLGEEPGRLVNDKPILGDLTWLAAHAAEVQAICGIGAPEVRRRLTRRAEALGVRFCAIIHPTAVLTRWVTVGKGSVIAAGAVLTNQIKLGRHVVIHYGCTIGHDAVLEDYVTLAPGAHISGNVRLEEGCYVGVGANIIEKKTIGAWSVVGAGSTIVKDVPPNTTVVGVPGQVIKTREPGWHLAGE